MPLDLVEFPPDLLRGHEWIVEMPLLIFVVFGEEGFVVGKGLDYRESIRLGFPSLTEVRERRGERHLLLSSGSARKRCLNKSVFLVALPVHMSQTLSLNGSATN